MNKTPTLESADIEQLRAIAGRLRRDSLITTTEAGSGHPTTCMSAADVVAALFFRYLRFDLENPKDPRNDRFVLSKGHAAPLLWAALAQAGAFPREHLHTLRNIDSDLEGHPTPRNRWVDVATGSLGQGLSAAVGMAIASKIDRIPNRVFALMGDGEIAEGAVWEAAGLASYRSLDNLIAIVDVNALGQSQRTMYGHDMAVHEGRFEAFGWQTRCIDGHDFEQIGDALDWACRAEGAPKVILAKTLKGKGSQLTEDKDGWHGKPVPADRLPQVLAELADDSGLEATPFALPDSSVPLRRPARGTPAGPDYPPDTRIATRAAYGNALRKLGAADESVVVLDGDTKNSTYSEKFLQAYPERFVECFIAEQNMVGAAAGLGAVGKTPFASTFAAFLTRAYDQVRMAAVSRANLKLCGSHAGASIGEDGPSQMGLEDLAMMRAVAGSTVLYPSDGVSAERAVALAARTEGIVYIRTTRPKTPILYPLDADFAVGKAKVLRGSSGDKVAVVAAGITLHEALAAYETLKGKGISVRVIDLFSVKPVDAELLIEAAEETGRVLTVEDHYPQGGLGDAVLDALSETGCRVRKLAISGLPRSGKPDELLDIFGVSHRCIVQAVEDFLS